MLGVAGNNEETGESDESVTLNEDDADGRGVGSGEAAAPDIAAVEGQTSPKTKDQPPMTQTAEKQQNED